MIDYRVLRKHEDWLNQYFYQMRRKAAVLVMESVKKGDSIE